MKLNNYLKNILFIIIKNLSKLIPIEYVLTSRLFIKKFLIKIMQYIEDCRETCSLGED